MGQLFEKYHIKITPGMVESCVGALMKDTRVDKFGFWTCKKKGYTSITLGIARMVVNIDESVVPAELWVVGVAIANPEDRVDKWLGRFVAASRARRGALNITKKKMQRGSICDVSTGKLLGGDIATELDLLEYEYFDDFNEVVALKEDIKNYLK